MTNLADSHVADAVYERAKRQFSQEELVNLTIAIIAINGWNRLSIAFRAVPGAPTSPRSTSKRPRPDEAARQLNCFP